jgi:hypothetical protein
MMTKEMTLGKHEKTWNLTFVTMEVKKSQTTSCVVVCFPHEQIVGGVPYRIYGLATYTSNKTMNHKMGEAQSCL